jgi:hypothetical protein
VIACAVSGLERERPLVIVLDNYSVHISERVRQERVKQERGPQQMPQLPSRIALGEPIN